MDQDKIRNFCIIAHIDHGKSTLADRLLESTNTIQKREMREQVLDMMDLERERGITIKLQPARMDYAGSILNLIDTPGHVDFNYEVSRSLAAVEGALLLVDATQGIQAQTLGNLYLAMEQNLTIIPVINKIDLANAEIEKTKEEIISLLGCKSEEIILASGKTGKGVEEVLESVVKKVPSPNGEADKPLRALIFDSKYDDYKGVVAYVRVRDGEIKKGDKMFLMAGKVESEVLEVGYFKPQFVPTDKLSAGEIGYIVTGLKEIEKCRVGDTVTASTSRAEVSALPGYKEVKPMVFAGVFCKEGNDFPKLREAMLKLKLNDASLTFETEQSKALGFGFRCGLLGLLHLEILEERIRREYNLDVIITVPSVAYKNTNRKGNAEIVKSPLEFPDPTFIKMVEEPWIKIDVVSPSQYLGGIMQLVQEKRGVYINTEYLEADRIIIHYEVPLSAILVDFYDKLKSVTSGYGSLNYEFLGYKKTDVVKMDILVAGESVEALSTIVYEDIVHDAGRRIVEALKKVLPRQMFEVKIQAAIGGKIVASEHLPAMKKDVTAKLYGGDVTRKRKLLEKQKKGKKKMMVSGRGSVDIPSETFVKILKK